MDLREFRVVVRIVDRVAKRALFAEEQMVALEGQCAEWKRIADELKAERNALRSTTIDTAAGSLLDAFGSLANEPRNGAPTPKRAWLALKKERDGFFVQIQDMRAELDRLLAQLREEKQHGDKLWSELHELRKLRARAHPVKVGEHVKNDNGDVCQVHEVYAEEYLLNTGWTWAFENCAPCDPPTASHDTPAGKETAQAAAEPKPGDTVRLVRVPTMEEYADWDDEFGGVGSLGVVKSLARQVANVKYNDFTWEWPISCIEIVEDAK